MKQQIETIVRCPAGYCDVPAQVIFSVSQQDVTLRIDCVQCERRHTCPHTSYPRDYDMVYRWWLYPRGGSAEPQDAVKNPLFGPYVQVRWKIFRWYGSRLNFESPLQGQRYYTGEESKAQDRRFGIHVYKTLSAAIRDLPSLEVGHELRGEVGRLMVYPVFVPEDARQMNAWRESPNIEAWDRIYVPTVHEALKAFPQRLLGWFL